MIIQDEQLYDITVIGAGPVGLYATFYAGLRRMKTKLIEALPELGGQLSVLYPDKFIYDVPGYPKVKAKDLVNYLEDQAMRFKPMTRLGERITHLETLPRGIIKLTSEKGVHYTRTVVISAGIGAFSPNTVGVPGEKEYEGRGVYYLVKNRAVFKDKNVLIVGGGDTAVDWALSLEHFARDVTLIHRRDVFRAHESSVSELLASDVRIGLFKELREIRGDIRVKGAVIQDNRTGEKEVLDVDAILIFIGFKASIEEMKSWGLKVGKRTILVNQRMETNIPGVYAVGDVAQPLEMVKLNLIVTGWGQAATAVNYAKNYIDKKASIFPGHSSDMGSH